LADTKPLQIHTANGDELLYVEGGSFVMGDTRGDGEDSERPAHRVNITYDLYVGKYPVTFEQYDRYCDATEYSEPDDEGMGRGRRPVMNLAWSQAIEYCNWLSEREGLPAAYYPDGNLLDEDGRKTNDITRVAGYRLLTEAEWEYAARGGKKGRGYRYSGSNDPDSVAWYEGNSRSMTQEVGMKKPNELGLYDMSGNVWEWCSDWYSHDYYDESPEVDPYNGVVDYCDEAVESRRVMRGGSADLDQTCARVTSRESLEPSAAGNVVGFRGCRTAIK